MADVEKVTYCTDVEGHWHYFCNFVDVSDGLCFAREGDHREAAQPPELVLKDGWHFVFGGDACDKGPGTLRFLEAVTRLKKKHPDRVHLILGNRDINKMRFPSEFTQAAFDELTPETPYAPWAMGNFKISPWAYFKAEAARVEGVPESDVTDAMVRARNTRAERLRFHFKHDMGSDGEFEFRRQELALMSDRAVGDVSDDEVLESYDASVREGGLIWEYMRLGQLAHIIGETLFVHGQIIGSFTNTPEQWCLGKVPDVSAGPDKHFCRSVEGVREWVDELNRWAQQEVEDWMRNPAWQALPIDSSPSSWVGRGGGELMLYGTPVTRQPSVVYGRWLEDKNMPKPLPSDLTALLKGNGIRRVVLGHTPHGNCPSVLPGSEDVAVIMADTSFSNMKSNLAYVGDNRGAAVASITISSEGCIIKGCTEKEGQAIEYSMPPGQGADSRVGCLATLARHHGVLRRGLSSEPDAKEYFVKARLAPAATERYLLCHIAGFAYEYEDVSSEFVEASFAAAGPDLSSIEGDEARSIAQRIIALFASLGVDTLSLDQAHSVLGHVVQDMSSSDIKALMGVFRRETKSTDIVCVRDLVLWIFGGP